MANIFFEGSSQIEVILHLGKYDTFNGTFGDNNSTFEMILTAGKGVPNWVSWALFPPYYLIGRQPSGTLLPEDGRLTFEGWLVVVKE